jgi:hypothetical protein
VVRGDVNFEEDKALRKDHYIGVAIARDRYLETKNTKET